MNPAAVFLAAATVWGGLGAVGGFGLGGRGRVWCAGVSTVGVGLASGAAAVYVLATGDPVRARWRDVLPLAGVTIDLDPLGAWFVLVAALVIVGVGWYSIDYCTGGLSGRAVQGTLPLFALTLVLVPAAGSVSTFLLLWELMAVTSLVLVVADHTERHAVAGAAVWYGAMTHFGFVAILVAFGLAAAGAGGESFTAIRASADDLSTARASVVFVLAVVGFVSKAGAVPLHVWLPKAHPEAPSHVSALMSGAMVKLGIYGVVRVGLDLLHDGPRWWGLLLVALGAVSALFGALHALVAADLKVLLAYSTTENVGLILLGIGAAVLLAGEGERVIAGAALAAALLHVLNHALFKGVLFLGAGSIVHATGTRDLDRLGGLVRRMPATTALFAVGSLAIAGLPPLNGFVSEWALLQVLLRAGDREPPVLALLMPVAVAVVALTAGLVAATFTKALGTGTLARPRSAQAEAARESPGTVLAGMGLLAFGCLVTGLFPWTVSSGLGRAARTAGAPVDPVGDAVATLRLAGVGGVMSPALLAVTLLVGAVAIVATTRALGMARVRRRAENWACGRVLETPRMEYTASSFAEPLLRVFHDVLHPDEDVDVSHVTESRWYVDTVRYRSEVADAVDRHGYRRLVDALARWGERARALQNGSLHRYLAYGFFGMLVVVVVAR